MGAMNTRAGLSAAASAYASLKVYRNIDTGTTGAVVLAQPGGLYGWTLTNNVATAVYVKLYDKATAATASDTPVLTLRIPASGTLEWTSDIGIWFSNGISVRSSTAIADNDATAPATNQTVVSLFYR